jgi:5-methylcytosine-specific restriction endonuclease McrA
VTSSCVECGESFDYVATAGQKPRATCSRRCERKIGRRQRRAYEKAGVIACGAAPTIQSLFSLSGGTCALCGLSVSIDASETFAGPTLDHITPLSKGGAHDISNAQLAHHCCNTLKSNGNQHPREFYRDAMNERLFQYVKHGLDTGGYPLVPQYGGY